MIPRTDVTAKLHVLTLTPFYPSDHNETNGCFIAEPLKELQLRGVLSSVIAVDSIFQSKRRENQTFPADRVRYLRPPGNFGLSSGGRLLAVSLRRKVREIHRQCPIHVIHAHAALPCGFAAKILSRELDIPFVVTIHGLDVFHSCYESGAAARWRKQASISVYESARKVICISDKVRLAVNEMGRSVVTAVVYNGSDTKLFAADLRKSRQKKRL